MEVEARGPIALLRDSKGCARTDKGRGRPIACPFVGAGANVLIFGRRGNAGSASARDALVLSAVPFCGA